MISCKLERGRGNERNRDNEEAEMKNRTGKILHKKNPR